MEFKRGFLNSKKGRDALHIEATASGSKSKLATSPPVSARSTASGTGATDSHIYAPSTPAGITKAAHSVSVHAPESMSSDPVDEMNQQHTSGIPPATQPSSASPASPHINGIPADLHALPPGVEAKPGYNRKVFSEWPRDPKGQIIRFKDHKEYGKRTPNGNRMWGETLWDFYMVRMMPENHYFFTWTSGSRIAAFMREYGELDSAPSELAWADAEGDPKQLFPCNVGRLICDRERQTIDCALDDEAARIFSSRVPTLQARIPFHLLPEKLIVHDPWNTLSIKDERDDMTTPVAERADIVHTFELSLSKESQEKQAAERDAAVAADKARFEKDEWRKIEPSAEEPGPLPPSLFAIYAKVPPRPPRPTSIPEAHLYIRREDKCGDGNHSVVYFSELELPRWTLVDDVLCETCWRTALLEEIRERRKSGTLRPDVSNGNVRPPEIKRTVKVFDDLRNPVAVETSCTERREVGLTTGGTDFELHHNTHRVVTDEYIGPVAYVYPKVTWQNPEHGPVCEHLCINGHQPPLTTRVKVCAKLSIQGDFHLAREAENYQAFPSYFFEHWNGYNLVVPLRDPTPCGALVPQFYGYYVPQGGFEPVLDTVLDEASAAKTKGAPLLPASYISPILLLEYCGIPINIDEMGPDDRNAAAALCQTFHFGGWAQNSMYERNVVVQPGPITEWPAFRGLNERWKSFRLIDFGRATPLDWHNQGFLQKKAEVCRMFKLFHYHPLRDLASS
ncbi:unnamed protein product [Peniophora sp. CBMAI 1063]|nr:unnamed protein product [Peniophora sp. CBMAI 1063]